MTEAQPHRYTVLHVGADRWEVYDRLSQRPVTHYAEGPEGERKAGREASDRNAGWSHLYDDPR